MNLRNIASLPGIFISYIYIKMFENNNKWTYNFSHHKRGTNCKVAVLHSSLVVAYIPWSTVYDATHCMTLGSLADNSWGMTALSGKASAINLEDLKKKTWQHLKPFLGQQRPATWLKRQDKWRVHNTRATSLSQCTCKPHSVKVTMYLFILFFLAVSTFLADGLYPWHIKETFSNPNN